MDDIDTADQRLAQVVRALPLVNFRLMQLRHTNDQLQAALADLLDQAKRTAPRVEAFASRQLKKDLPHDGS